MDELALHITLLLLAPPLIAGIVPRVKAWYAGRQGQPLLQPWFDLLKLVRKGAVYSRTTSWVFRAGPVVSLASVLAAGMLLPLGSGRAPFGFEGDILLFAYLLGLGRFFTIAAALDTGSSFEGMGASREATFSALAEPALLLALAIICLPAHTASFGPAFDAVAATGDHASRPALLLAALALFIVMLAENSRMPVDDPNTHLELTMVHEVMVLDHGGPDLAFIAYGAAVKFFLFGALLAHLLLPVPSGGGWTGAAVLLAGQAVIAALVGVVESVMARIRLPRVPQFLVGATVLAAIGLVVLFNRGRP